MYNKPKYAFLPRNLITYRALRDGASTTDTNGILYDLKAMEYLYSQPIFQKQSIEQQLIPINQFLGCTSYNCYKWNNKDLRKKVLNDAKQILKFVEDRYSKKDLRTTKQYSVLNDKVRYPLWGKIKRLVNLWKFLLKVDMQLM